MKKNFGWWIALAIVGGAILVAVYILATQALWNWLVPEIFNGPVITYWQTAGLMLLVCMFGWIGFGGHGGGKCRHHGGKHKWKSKWDDKWCCNEEDSTKAE